jgi:hypothetical protein
MMETIAEALRLLKRQAAIQNDVRRTRGSRVVQERELYLIRNKLARYPAAVQAITLTASELHRPIEYLRVSDIERHC